MAYGFLYYCIFNIRCFNIIISIYNIFELLKFDIKIGKGKILVLIFIIYCNDCQLNCFSTPSNLD